MKILLKQPRTGLWLQPSGRWEPGADSAREFSSTQEALLVSEETHLPELRLCFRFEHQKLNFEMPAQRAF